MKPYTIVQRYINGLPCVGAYAWKGPTGQGPWMGVHSAQRWADALNAAYLAGSSGSTGEERECESCGGATGSKADRLCPMCYNVEQGKEP